MKRKDVVEAAAIIKSLDGVKALRATLKGGKHELRLYALTEKETMEDEVEVDDPALAELLVSRIIIELESRLKTFGVNQ